MTPFQLFIGTTHILGLMALVVLGFSWCIRFLDGSRWKQVVVGLIFAAGGLVSMLDPLHLQPGIQSDARLPLLTVSYSFGGWPATAIVSAVLMVVRLSLGGAGAMAGLAAITAAAGLGLATAKIIRRRKLRPLHRRALYSVIIVASIVLSLCLVGPVRDSIPLAHTAVLIAFNILATILFDDALRHAKRNYAATRVLQAAADTDPLTRLKNRRAFSQQAERLLDENGSGAIIMFDIDHFKTINDTYGHDVGDAVLCEVARIVQSELRKDDLVARYGGEEIIAFIPGGSTLLASAIADAVRARIQSHQFHGSQALRVTLSAGTAHGAESLATLTKRADEALYLAKRKGRNRVEWAEAA